MTGEELLPRGEPATIRDILGGKVLGNKPGNEWVEKRLKRLQEKLKLQVFDLERGFSINRRTPDEISEIFYGEKILGEGIVGFSAGVIGGELKMLSVFAALSNRLVWIRKEVGQREEFYKIVFRNDLIIL
jgi:hypothetical protein